MTLTNAHPQQSEGEPSDLSEEEEVEDGEDAVVNDDDSDVAMETEERHELT